MGKCGSGSEPCETQGVLRVARITNVTAMTFGNSHSLALTSSSEDNKTTVWVFGWNRRGAHGSGSAKHATNKSPAVIAFFKGIVVTEIAAGSDRSAARTADGRLFMWGGQMVFGLCGVGTTQEKVVLPTLVVFPTVLGTSYRCKRIFCSVHHCVALCEEVLSETSSKKTGTTNLALFSWGNRMQGGLGVGEGKGSVLSPCRITYSFPGSIVHVGVGLGSTYCICEV